MIMSWFRKPEVRQSILCKNYSQKVFCSYNLILQNLQLLVIQTIAIQEKSSKENKPFLQREQTILFKRTGHSPDNNCPIGWNSPYSILKCNTNSKIYNKTRMAYKAYQQTLHSAVESLLNKQG